MRIQSLFLATALWAGAGMGAGARGAGAHNAGRAGRG